MQGRRSRHECGVVPDWNEAAVTAIFVNSHNCHLTPVAQLGSSQSDGSTTSLSHADEAVDGPKIVKAHWLQKAMGMDLLSIPTQEW